MMNYIWTPWRMEYILRDKKEGGCVFCQALAQPEVADNLVVFVGERAFVLLNRFPYTSGHVMVVPGQHVSTLEQLDTETRAEMMELTNKAVLVLQQAYRPEGFNIGMNIGTVAGAGIAEHLHLHIVPRWGGDTSFISSLGQTRILPEALEDTLQRVRKAWENNEV